MTRRPGEILPEHWLDSQRLMVGLTLALVQDAGSMASLVLLEKALKYLRAPVGLADPAVAAEYLKRLETIHPATLKRLTELSPALLPTSWKPHLKFWRLALYKLQLDGARFPLVGARLVADRIVNSSLTPEQIRQLGEAELSPAWQDYFPCKELGAVLASAKDRNRVPHDLLNALSQFRNAKLPVRWEIVENAILQKLFIWPLIILETKERSLELSLPVLLQVATTDEQLPAIVNAGRLDAGQWVNSVRRATTAAKDLWQNKHKASFQWFQKSVEQLSASIDLEYAARIFEEFAVEPFAVSLGLKGESAEAYFALAILAALTDPVAIENVCATGTIENLLKDDEGGGDHVLGEPTYIEQKFHYARDCYFFDTFLTPKPSVGVESERHIYVPREVQENERAPGRTCFSHFCDYVFEQKWRKHQYVRAPDLAEAFRPQDRNERNNPARWKVGKVEKVLEGLLEKLKDNQEPAIHIDDISAEKIAVALFAVNKRVKWNAVGSYAFFRSVPEAVNERMWWPIWDLISGDPTDFPSLQFAASPRLAAIALAREMNKMQPQETDPRRAPDVLVVAYTKVDAHFESDSAVLGSPFERHRIAPMIGAINSLTGKQAMRPSPIPELREHIGATRIIFVRDTSPLAQAPVEGQLSFLYDNGLREAVHRLSVFRYGFKREHARRILNVPEDECDRILGSLRSPIAGHPPLLGFSGGAGEYFLKRKIDTLISGRNLAELHFGAANAITGLLAPADGAFRTNLRDAFSPRWVQEAQWHLEKALELIQDVDANILGNYRKARQRVSRLAEPFGWTNVRWLTRQISRKRVTNGKPLPDAEFLEEAIKLHFDSVEESKSKSNKFWSSTHPIEYVVAARYFNELALQSDIPLRKKSKFIEFRDNYLEKGLTRIAGDNWMNQVEKRSCYFSHAAAKICMLLADEPDESGVARSEQVVEQLQAHMEYQSCLDKSDKDLFEYLGDRVDDHFDAMRWYRMGISNPTIGWTKPRPSLAFKFVGAAKLAGVSISQEVKLALDRLWAISDPGKRTIRVGGLDKLQRVQERWRVGKRAILEGEREFGTYSDFRIAITKFPFGG